MYLVTIVQTIQFERSMSIHLRMCLKNETHHKRMKCDRSASPPIQGNHCNAQYRTDSRCVSMFAFDRITCEVCREWIMEQTKEENKQIYPCQVIYVFRSIIRVCIAFSIWLSSNYPKTQNNDKWSTAQHCGVQCLLHGLNHDHVELEKKKGSDSDTNQGTRQRTRKMEYGTVPLLALVYTVGMRLQNLHETLRR